MALCKLGTITDGTARTEGMTAAAASAHLRAAGFDIGPTTVKDHRAGRCACARPTVDTIVAPPADVVACRCAQTYGRHRGRNRCRGRGVIDRPDVGVARGMLMLSSVVGRQWRGLAWPGRVGAQRASY